MSDRRNPAEEWAENRPDEWEDVSFKFVGGARDKYVAFQEAVSQAARAGVTHVQFSGYSFKFGSIAKDKFEAFEEAVRRAAEAAGCVEYTIWADSVTDTISRTELLDVGEEEG